MDIFFKSEAHRGRFLAAIQQFNKTFDGYYEGHTVPLVNEEYGAALYVLTSSSGTWERAKSYIGRGIQFDEMLANEHWSGGYISLLQLAGNLFNAGYTIVCRNSFHQPDHKFSWYQNTIPAKTAHSAK